MRGPRVLVVDNRDSFVFNLVDDLARLGARPEVVRSQMEATDLDSCVAASGAELLVFSPGPGHPAEAGVMIPFLQAKGPLPVLGVCLGMQAMVCALGGTVERAPRPVHGRSSRIRHWGDPVFEGVEDGFDAGRYHSLVAAGTPARPRPLIQDPTLGRSGV